MKVPRSGLCAITVGDMIHVIGGRDNNDEIKDTDEIFVASSSPTFLKTLSGLLAFVDPATLVLTGGLLLTGVVEWGQSFPSFSRERYQHQKFFYGDVLPIPTSNMSAVALGRYIIIIGGQTTNGDIVAEPYILADDLTASEPTWQKINVQLQTARFGHTTILLENFDLCILGGDDGNDCLGTIERISIFNLLAEWEESQIASVAQEDAENLIPSEWGQDEYNGDETFQDDEYCETSEGGDCFCNCNLLKQLSMNGGQTNEAFIATGATPAVHDENVSVSQQQQEVNATNVETSYHLLMVLWKLIFLCNSYQKCSM